MPNSVDEKYFRDKRAHYRGRAKVPLQNLQYYGSSVRGAINKHQISKLRQVYKDEGCMRLHIPENYVPAVISLGDLNVGLQYSGQRGVDLLQDGEPRFLRFPEHIKIKVLHGEHRLRAAEEFLEPTDKWWTVVLYTEDIGPCTETAIREEYAHQLKFSDGDIYRYIRYYESQRNFSQVEKWTSRLSTKKARNLRQLENTHRELQHAFDQSVPLAGLWHSFQLGCFNRILPLGCQEELVHYVRHVHNTWVSILEDPQLFQLLDSNTVDLLETLTPEATHDAALIKRMASNGELFPAIDQPTVRESIIPRILNLRGRIPSFFNFFEDTIYFETWIKALRPLLPTNGSAQTNRRFPARSVEVLTFRSSFFHIFTDMNQINNQVRIQVSNQRFRTVTGGVERRKILGYLTLFLAAMRDFPVLSQTPPHRSPGQKKGLIEGSIEGIQSRLALLALDLGFDTPSIRTLAARNPDILAIRECLQRLRPADEFDIDDDLCEDLLTHAASELQRLAVLKSRRIEPVFSSDLDNLPKKSRVGLPDYESHQKDRQHLFVDTLTDYNAGDGHHLTSLSFKYDIFICFFGEFFPIEPEAAPSSGLDDWSGCLSPEASSHLPGQDSSEHGDLGESDATNYVTQRPGHDSLSVYDTTSQPSSPSPPMSNFQDHIQSMQASIWPHMQSDDDSAGSENSITNHSHGLAHGFETSVRNMNEFHRLENDVVASRAAMQFIANPTMIVVYLWTERTYRKFMNSPSQRWLFENVMDSLFDRDFCFAVLEGAFVRLKSLSELWAVAREAGLLFVGPKSVVTAQTTSRFLTQIDNINARDT